MTSVWGQKCIHMSFSAMVPLTFDYCVFDVSSFYYHSARSSGKNSRNVENRTTDCRKQDTGFNGNSGQKKNQNTQWDDTEKKNNTQPFIYLYISSAHGQTLSMCEKTKNKKTKFRVLISPGSSPEQWGRADSVCYKISSGSRSNAVHTSLYLSSLFVAH